MIIQRKNFSSLVIISLYALTTKKMFPLSISFQKKPKFHGNLQVISSPEMLLVLCIELG